MGARLFGSNSKGSQGGKEGLVAVDHHRHDYGLCRGGIRGQRFRQGKKEFRKSFCITFEEDIPDRVYIDYVCNRVRPYEEAPLRGFCCQE